ncbi:hypothetical protein L345_09590 [Ophiophagus hannah]|uniref:Uncharacterized protein n=1 Tax=Ophiophagus hannah TaxID=8665 RepID=V8NRR2_OPHHA|nr:hypothetical protein L345_09590 [Ophiophagus hannah]
MLHHPHHYPGFYTWELLYVNTHSLFFAICFRVDL